MDEETANIILLSEGVIQPREKICDTLACVYMFIIFAIAVFIIWGTIYVSEHPVKV
jgi:hypothetical protein